MAKKGIENLKNSINELADLIAQEEGEEFKGELDSVTDNEALKALVLAFKEGVEEVIGQIEMPESIRVANPVKEVSVLNFPKEKEYPKEIKVNNLKDIKIPAVPKEFRVTGFTSLLNGIKSLSADLKNYATKTVKAVVTGEVTIANRDLNEAIPVKLVSNDGKYFYTAIQNMLGAMVAQITQVKNASGNLINPATEETQQDILNALGGSSATTMLGQGNKNVTVAGTAEALAGSTDCKRVQIRAKPTNTNFIFVGGAGVSSTDGLFLQPYDSVTININNLNAVYIDAVVSGEGVVYTYEN